MLNRMLRLKEAAAYCGVPLSRIRGICPVPPIKITSSSLWDRNALDAWLDTLLSGGTEDAEQVAARVGISLQYGLERI